MKRKNLFLSLICSLILTIALVAVSIVTIVPKKDKDKGGQTSSNVSDNVTDKTPDVTVNEDKDGSAEKPYVIYSVETFETFIVDKYVDENGEYIDYTQVDEEGNLLYPELAAGLHYVLDSDIDFADAEFKTIFNEGVPFNGHIDGKGFALKNININVTKEALVSDYTYKTGTELVANIGVFGEIENAEIKNITLNGVNIAMDEDLYSYVWSAEFPTEEGTMKSISVGSLAGVAKNSTIEAKVTASIDGFAYSVYVNNKADGLFAVGGLVAAAVDSTISNSEIDVDIVAVQGAKYYVGGVAGCVNGTTINKVKVDAQVSTNYEKALYIAGVAGYAIGANVEEAEVALKVTEAGTERFVTKGVTSIDSTKFVSIAGAIHTININDNDTASTVKNVTIVSDVDIDGVFAGAVMNVIGGKETIVVELSNIIADSNVNVLKAYGFAGSLSCTKVVLDAENVKTELVNEEQVTFNVRLTGNVKLSIYTNKAEGVRMFPASMFVLSSDNCEGVTGGARKSVNIIVSYEIFEKVISTETIILRNWGSVVKV